MQFTKIIAAVFVATAVAAPTGGGSSGSCTISPSESGTTVCCTQTIIGVGLLNCVLGACNTNILGRKSFCCDDNSVQNGLINLSLLNCGAL